MRFYEVIVSIDSERYVCITKKSGDNTSSWGTMLEVLDNYKKSEKRFYYNSDIMQDVVIILTSSLSHLIIISECLAAGLRIFTELNLDSSNYKENIKLASAIGKVLFLSSTFFIVMKLCIYRKK
ncbi:MAG: hypothetical protein HFH66_13890 [Lachnospiraceae bacterium]|nr:hypothetical protein [Lachnospiraceae bacterium]